MAKPKKRPKFPNKIRAWREHRNLTQEQLGERIYRSQETVGRYESGAVDTPTSALIAIGYALSCSEHDLLHREPASPTPALEEFAELKADDQRLALALYRAVKNSGKAA